MMLTVIDLPFPPSVNSLFANRRGGRYRTDRYNTWAIVAGTDLKGQKPKPVHGRVMVWIAVERIDKRRRDLDNLGKAPLDLLVKHKIIDDDSMVDDFRVYRDSSVKGCRVSIQPALEAA